jgi:hypothetical protein
MSLKTAIGRRVDIVKWAMSGKAKYLAETPFLTKPQPTGNAELDRCRKDFYEKGVAVTSGFAPSRSIPDLLQGIKNEFTEVIEIFDKSLPEGKRVDYVDGKRRQWYINAAEGVLQCLFDDPTHEQYNQVYNEKRAQLQKEKKFATVQDLLTQFPTLKEAIENPVVHGLAAYANDGYTRPVSIKLERKTLTTGANYNRIHFDTHLSTFKTYLYLTDVSLQSGAFAYAEGSHHWKMYPQMLFEVMAKKKKLFVKEDLERYGLKPFSYAALPAGSLFCFTGNIIHSATNVEVGERWSVQFYYYTSKMWSTDRSLSG